jgi:hypothetical protein
VQDLGGVGDGEGREVGGDGVGVEEDETGLGELSVIFCVVLVGCVRLVVATAEELEATEFGVLRGAGEGTDAGDRGAGDGAGDREGGRDAAANRKVVICGPETRATEAVVEVLDKAKSEMSAVETLDTTGLRAVAGTGTSAC